MTDSTGNLDLVELIVESFQRTSEPTATADGSMEEGKGDQVIDSVPMHLRHLHNLLTELLIKGKSNPTTGNAKRFVLVRELFFEALLAYVVKPEGTKRIIVLENWDVVASFCFEEDEYSPDFKRLIEIMAHHFQD